MAAPRRRLGTSTAVGARGNAKALRTAKLRLAIAWGFTSSSLLSKITFTSIILFSETVTFIIGTDKNTFSIQKDLLVLHSDYFADRFRDGVEDEKLLLPHLKTNLFVDFVSYLYTGKVVDISNEALGSDTRIDELWERGGYLKAPGFQNMCMDDRRLYCQLGDKALNPWPFIHGIETMYKYSKEGSVMRGFAAHSMVANNPLITKKEESKEFKEDMALAVGKKWNYTDPWDDEHRAGYMEKEIPLEQRWEKHILSTRTKPDIQKVAKAKCIRSIIELEHLTRGK